MSILFILQTSPQWSPPVWLLMAIAAVLGTLNVTQGVFGFLQGRKTSEANTWKGAAEALKVELPIVRERADRLDRENKLNIREIEQLKAKTDLKPLHDQIESANRRNEEIHIKMIAAIEELGKRDSDAMSQLTNLVVAEFGEHRKAFANISSVLEGVNRELQQLNLNHGNNNSAGNH